MSSSTNTNDIEVSVVIPCLNEAETIANCVRQSQKAVSICSERWEIIVADNNSTDESAAIASETGAIVVSVKEKGYGNALMAGINAARGKFIVMCDADESHDFFEIPTFINKLREGFDLAQGCRLPAGGGTISKGSMSFLHRQIGNPFFSLLVRWWFKVPIHDVNCGFRGFTRDFYNTIDQRCTGMEFSPEMIIKASLAKAKIIEVPITHHPPGRTFNPPHLRTFRDGWRTLRFFLMFSPRWLFLLPGISLVISGLLAYLLFIFDFVGSSFNLQIQVAVYASLAILCGYQSVLFAIFTKAFAIGEGMLPEDKRFDRFFEIVNLERGLLLAFITLFFGFIFIILAFLQINFLIFQFLDFIFIGATMIAVGFQTILSGFFSSILGMKRK